MSLLSWASTHPALALLALLALLRLPLLLLQAYLSLLRQPALQRARTLRQQSSASQLVGLFHPFCNAGGGGERVLWTALSGMQASYPELAFVVYSGDFPGVSKEAILARAQDHFNIHLSPSSIHFIPLPSRRFIGDGYWRRLTLLGQAWGALKCAWESMVGREGVLPDVFIDTMGYAWSYPLVRLLAGKEVPIGAYVHYPTISPDMVHRVANRLHTHTNVSTARSPVRSAFKLAYYRVLIMVYAWCLSFGEEVMANSTWTKNHLDTLLGSGRTKGQGEGKGSSEEEGEERVVKVCPPCDVSELVGLSLEDGKRERVVLSLAQFRPEKDHLAQLRALRELFELRPTWKAGGEGARVRLVMMGSVRDEADAQRVEGLRREARELDISDNVEFVVNGSYKDVCSWLGRASVGLSTMVDEHFGINVVEFMAAGLIPLAHASAGPYLDIILPHPLPSSYTPSLTPPLSLQTGFHALTPREFAGQLERIFELTEQEREGMRKRARESVRERFGNEAFQKLWEMSFERLRKRVAAA